jgi:hypothetical protein
VDQVRRPGFEAAPLVHPFNRPAYHAQICHGVEYAKAMGKQIYWTVAADWPLTVEDEALGPERLEQMRESWLERPPKDTAGLFGMLPLADDMPMRFTENIDRAARIFKHGRAVFKGIELADGEAQRISEVEGPEVILRKQPVALHLQVEAASGDKLYRLELQYRTWTRDKEGSAKVSTRIKKMSRQYTRTNPQTNTNKQSKHKQTNKHTQTNNQTIQPQTNTHTVT